MCIMEMMSSGKKVCEREDIDLIYIATDWVNHAPIMDLCYATWKHVACEVPAALTLEEIWEVVNTAELTRKHCMMLENCVYDFFEITTLNMAQQGCFWRYHSCKRGVQSLFV